MDAHRGLSSLLAVLYLLLAWRDGGSQVAVWLVVPLGVLVWIIWHADEAAAFIGTIGLTPVRRPSPPGLVRALAWLLLLVPLVGTVLGMLR